MPLNPLPRIISLVTTVTTESDVFDRHHDDWHRVEFMLERFKREIAELRSQGWRDA
jgi:hypothetical protein